MHFRFLFSILSLFINNSIFSGFAPHTLVSAFDGHTKICDVKIQDKVSSLYDNQIAESAVLGIKSYRCKESICIQLQASRRGRHPELVSGLNLMNKDHNTEIISSSDQKFYLPLQAKWLEAQDLVVGDNLLSIDGKYISISKILKQSATQKFYDISVSGAHNYFVSEQSILVHNFAVGAGLAWAFGSGSIKFAGASLCASIGGLLGVKVIKDIAEDKPTYKTQITLDQERHQNIYFNEVQESKDKENNEVKKPERTFEDIEVEAEPGEETKGKSTIFEKPGDKNDAVKDFKSLKPSNVRVLSDGKMIGVLDDGRTVNVRKDSTDKRATLEAYDGITGKSRKIRYGNKDVRN